MINASSSVMPVLPMLVIALFVLPAVIWLVWVFTQEYGSSRVACLLYHQLQPASSRERHLLLDPVYVCYEDRFREQMDFLRTAGYETITVGEFMAARRGERALPLRPVLITFDDGFGSNYELAFPVLRRNGQRATIFMVPDRDSQNFRAYADQDRALTDAELRELSEHGIDIQSHGLSHRFLTDLEDGEVRKELLDSRAILERVTGKPVRYLAIPGGAYDARVRRLAHSTGYEAVFCMRKGSAGLSTNPYLLPRMVVSRDTTLEEFRKLLTPAAWIQGRIISVVQEGLGNILGPRGLNSLRLRLYGSPLAPLLKPQRLAAVLLGGFLAGLIALVLALVL